MQKYFSTKSVFAAVLLLVVFYFGKTLFVPLFFALMVSFIIYPVCKWFERKGVSKSMAIATGLVIGLLPVAAILFLFVSQVEEVGKNWHFISVKIRELTGGLNFPDASAMTQVQREEWINTVVYKNYSQLFSGVVFSLATLLQLVLIPVYAALLLYHRGRLIEFFIYVFPEKETGRFKIILGETVVAYYNFIKGMLLVYLIVGTLNSVGLYFLGIPHAFIFGFTASVLTFIPYIGILVGSVMPVITAWSMHDSIYYPLGVVAVFSFVQVLEANIIFPFAVSTRIKVNTLATLVAIFAGAIIWGTAGMILFIPFVAFLKLIADKTESLRPLALLLGDSDEKNHREKPVA